jgi:hypothetical protein
MPNQFYRIDDYSFSKYLKQFAHSYSRLRCFRILIQSCQRCIGWLPAAFKDKALKESQKSIILRAGAAGCADCIDYLEQGWERKIQYHQRPIKSIYDGFI